LKRWGDIGKMLLVSKRQFAELERIQLERFLQELHAHQQRVGLVAPDVPASKRLATLREDVDTARELGFSTEYEIMMVADLFALFGRSHVCGVAEMTHRPGRNSGKNLELLLRELNHEPEEQSP